MAEETTNLICITCPMGCALTVTHDGKTVLKVEGNQCKQGPDYAAHELSDPRRMITTTVRVQGGLHPLLPVYTAAPVPKPLVFDLLNELRGMELRAPVHAGDVVLANALGTGVNVLASRDVPARD